MISSQVTLIAASELQGISRIFQVPYRPYCWRGPKELVKRPLFFHPAAQSQALFCRAFEPTDPEPDPAALALHSLWSGTAFGS